MMYPFAGLGTRIITAEVYTIWTGHDHRKVGGALGSVQGFDFFPRFCVAR